MAAAPDVLIQYGVGVNSHNYSMCYPSILQLLKLFSLEHSAFGVSCSMMKDDTPFFYLVSLQYSSQNEFYSIILINLMRSAGL